MSKIQVSKLLALFQQMEAEHWPYVAGAAERGQVDCSGAFVWAYKQCGKTIYHGSNRIARYEVEELIPVGQADIVPGMAAFKSRQAGFLSGYALPDDYKQGGRYYNGDLNDYYHIGLVGEDCKTVLNAQSAANGFVSSPISQNWVYVARLKQVEYEAGGEEEPSEDVPSLSVPAQITSATVWAKNGKPVRMRNKPSDDPDTTTWVWVPVGAKVAVRALAMDGWAPIRYNGKDGYMMEQFLLYGGEDDTPGPFDWVASSLTEAQAAEIAAKYENAVIRQIQG